MRGGTMRKRRRLSAEGQLIVEGSPMATIRSFSKVPARPDIMAKIRMTRKLVRSGADLGRFAASDALDIRTYAKIISRPASSRAHTLVSPTREFAPATGTRRGLVLLVDFSDNPSTKPPAHFEELLFSQGSYSTGSMRDYYREVSYGQLNLIGDVFGWYRAPEPYAYYTNHEHGFGLYPQNVHRLVEDVVQLAGADANFSDYDLDNDGFVDAPIIVHAGLGAEATLDPDHIWSHRSELMFPMTVSGVKVKGYTMQPEDGKIGVFCHEFGHNLGLPDLYDTDYDSSGIGDWCLMAGGSWNDRGYTPAHMSAWCKMKLGWVTPRVIFNAEKAIGLAASATSAEVLKLPVGDPAGKEYFLIENRRKAHFDRKLPGEGLLIWHIDDNIINNDNQSHFMVALEQADGLANLENGADEGDPGDPFPGSVNLRSFNQNTNPSSRSYDGSDSKIAVSHIGDPGPTIDLQVRVGEVPARRGLGDRRPEDLFGLSQAVAAKLKALGINSISQVAEMDVLALTLTLEQDALKLFSYKARAQAVAAFNLDIGPFQAIKTMKMDEILARARAELTAATGEPESKIVELKDRLAILASALDKSALRQLTLEDVA
jgi:immune inhibitor A